MITPSAQWTSISQTPAKMTLVARLYYGAQGASDYISLGTDDITIDSERFLGVIKVFPSIRQEVNIETNEPTVSSLNLSINNQEYQPGGRFSDLLESLGAGADLGFENRRADIRMHLEGITSFSNCFPLLQYGIIRKLPHSWRDATIVIEDGVELTLSLIENLIAETDAANTDVGLPPDSKGKTKPIIWGNHEYEYGTVDDPADTTTAQDSTLVPAIDLGLDSTGVRRWLVADHKMDSLSRMWAWDSSISRYVEMDSFTIEQNTAAGCIISVAADPTYVDRWYGDKTVSNENNTAPGDWQDDTDANDVDLDTYALSEIASGVSVLTSARIDVDFSGYEPPTSDANISEVANYAQIYWTMGIALTYTNVNFRINDVKVTFSGEEDTLLLKAAGTESADLAGVHRSIEMRHDRDISIANTETTARVYEIWKQIKYTKDDILPLFSGGVGAEYGTWINSRTGPPAHQDNNLSGSAIENFSGAIEDLLRTWLGQATANVDLVSFNEISVILAAFKVASSVVEPVESKALITSWLKDTGSYFWWDTAGTFKVDSLEDSYASGDVDLIIDFNDFEFLDFERTGPELQATNVFVKYMWNSVRHALTTTPTVYSTAQTRYNVTTLQTTLGHETKNVKAAATAALVQAKLGLWWSQPHNLAIGTLGKEYLHLDIGDIIQFKNMGYKVRGKDITITNTIAGQDIYPYFKIYQVARGEKMNFKAIQLHKLS